MRNMRDNWPHFRPFLVLLGPHVSPQWGSIVANPSSGWAGPVPYTKWTAPFLRTMTGAGRRREFRGSKDLESRGSRSGGQERASRFLGVCRVHAVPAAAETCTSHVGSQGGQPGPSPRDPHRPLPLKRAQRVPSIWGASATFQGPQRGFWDSGPTFPLP